MHNTKSSTKSSTKSTNPKLANFNLEMQVASWVKHHSLESFKAGERLKYMPAVKLVYGMDDFYITSKKGLKLKPTDHDIKDTESAKKKFLEKKAHPVMGKTTKMSDALKTFIESSMAEEERKPSTPLSELSKKLGKDIEEREFAQTFSNKSSTQVNITYNETKATGRVFSWGLETGFSIGAEVGFDVGMVSAKLTLSGHLDSTIGIQRSKNASTSIEASYPVRPGYKAIYTHKSSCLTKKIPYDITLSGSFLLVFKTPVLFDKKAHTFSKPSKSGDGSRLHFIPIALIFSSKYFNATSQEFNFDRKKLPKGVEFKESKPEDSAEGFLDSDKVSLTLQVRREVMDVLGGAEVSDSPIEGYEAWEKLQTYHAKTKEKLILGSSKYDATDMETHSTVEVLDRLMVNHSLSLGEVVSGLFIPADGKRVLSREFKGSLCVIFSELIFNQIFTEGETRDNIKAKLLLQLPDVNDETTEIDVAFMVNFLKQATSPTVLNLDNKDKIKTLKLFMEEYESLPKKLTLETLEVFENDIRAQKEIKLVGEKRTYDIKALDEEGSKASAEEAFDEVRMAIDDILTDYLLNEAWLKKLVDLEPEKVKEKVMEVFDSVRDEISKEGKVFVARLKFKIAASSFREKPLELQKKEIKNLYNSYFKTTGQASKLSQFGAISALAVPGPANTESPEPSSESEENSADTAAKKPAGV